MRKCKCDYTFNIIDDVLVIEDLNQGNMSVTNGAEDVITEIYQNIGENIKRYPIIYKDSEGIWDGLKPVWALSECVEIYFLHIGSTDLSEAIQKAKEKKQ
jgi:glutamate formiminotransferase